MFCAYCGSKNPDDALFCGNCGAAMKVRQQPVTSAPVQQPNPPVYRNPVPAPQKKKSSSNWVIVFVLGMFILGAGFAFYATSSGSSDRDEKSSGVQSTEPARTTPVRLISEEYEAVFESNGLDVPNTDFFATPYRVSAYAGVLDGGVVENMEFAHEGDIVVSMVDTVYIPVGEMDDATREQLHMAMMESLGTYETMDCCILSSHKGADFYVYRLEIMDLDDVNNVRMVSSAGVVTVTDENELVGIAATEQNLLASGYVKR